MNAKQIKDEILKLNLLDKIDLYSWLDLQTHTETLFSRMGMGRVHAIRHGDEQKCRVIS